MRFGELIDGIYRSLRKTFWPIWWFLFLLNTPFLLIIIGGYYWIDDIFDLEILIVVLICLYLFNLHPVFQHGCTQMVTYQLKHEKKRLKWFTPFIFPLQNIWRLWIVNGILMGMLLVVVILITLIIGFPVSTFYISSGAPWKASILPILVISGMISFIVVCYLWVRLSLALPITSFEQVTWKESFVRSWILTDRSYFTLFGKWLVWALLQLPILFSWIFFATSFEAPELFSVIVCLLTSPIIQALGSILLSFLYIDQRARKEAFDLQMQLTDRGEESHDQYRSGAGARTTQTDSLGS